MEAIEEATEIEGEAIQDIHSILEDRYADFDSVAMGEETAFSLDSYYQRKSISGDDWQYEWREFDRMLKTEARFFSRSGAAFLGELFNHIDKKQTRNRKPLIVTAGPETNISSIFRARVFQSEPDLSEALSRPHIHLGPPPSHYAKAGRMNAHGISVFYGANKPDVALAEVRPPVGSVVVVAKFDLIRPLQLLDITALEDIYESGSIFDSSYVFQLGKVAFLRTLQDHITRPVMPSDELTEYLSTQAVADFLATEANVPIDGIIYPSVQSDVEGLNIVLFHKSSFVEPISLPEGSKVEVNLGYPGEDGWEDNYSVYISKPEKKLSDIEQESESQFLDMPFSLITVNEEGKIRESGYTTLKIDLDEIKIHRVQKIKVITSNEKLSWYSDPN